MAQFIPFSPSVEVNGQTILSFINAVPNNAFATKVMKDVLIKYELENVQPDAWYKQKLWLSAFEDISRSFGKATLFLIGRVIPESAIFPPQVNSLESALRAIDVAYNMNH